MEQQKVSFPTKDERTPAEKAEAKRKHEQLMREQQEAAAKRREGQRSGKQESEAERYWGKSQYGFFEDTRDQIVEFCFLDGKAMRGKVTGWGRYDLCITTESGETVLIWKSALKWARQAKPNGEGSK